MPRPRTLALATLLAAAVTLAGASGATAQPPRDAATPLVFPVVFHVAADDEGQVVADRALLEAWVAEASRLFAPAGVGVRVGEVRPLPAGSARLETIAARHRLKRHFVDGRINVFVVGEILDPHPSVATRRAAARLGREPTGQLAGAHIPYAGHAPGTYLIVRASPDPRTLTHELGHFFGVAHHPDPENLMSYGRERHRFDDAQLRTFRARARRLHASRAVRAR